MRCSVYIATSLDGFIARPDGRIDWLMAAADPNAETDYGYAEFTATIDCMIMGRATLEQLLTFGQWPYGDTRLIVLSNTLTAVPEGAPDTVELYSGDLRVLLDRLAAQGHQHAYVDGGQTIQSFLREGLINDLIITAIPLLIGEGLPLFGPLPADQPLHHLRTTAYPNGFVQSVYEVAASHPSQDSVLE